MVGVLSIIFFWGVLENSHYSLLLGRHMFSCREYMLFVCEYVFMSSGRLCLSQDIGSYVFFFSRKRYEF